MSEYEHMYEEAAAYLLQRTSARPVGELSSILTKL
jgi:hypothetical protein